MKNLSLGNLFTGWRSTLGGIAVLFITVGAVGTALKLALTGDLAGAWAAVSATWPEFLGAITGLWMLLSKDPSKN
jgi:hypothetical protein